MLKRIFIAALNRAGYEIHAKWRMQRLAYVRKLRQILSHHRIECVIDVGANEGQFHDLLRLEVGFTGTIHSFEPLRSLIDKLERKRVSDPKWFVYPFALGAQESERDINVMRSTVFSSFLEPAHDSVPEVASLNTIVAKARVRIRTLSAAAETLCPAIDLGRTFLKLDTQGFDLEVLKGGKSVIAQMPALQTEVSVRGVYRSMPDIHESLKMFGELGFGVSDFFVVAEDDHLRAIEFDCLMVR